MIREWQPIMPTDEVRFKARVLYEIIKTDKTTELVVGQGIDFPIKGSRFGDQDIVAWREYDCAVDARRENPLYVPAYDAPGNSMVKKK